MNISYLSVIFWIASISALDAQPKYYYLGKLSFQNDDFSREPLAGIVVKTSGNRTRTNHQGVFYFNSLQSDNMDLSFELPDTLKLAQYEGNTVAANTFPIKADNPIDWIVVKKVSDKSELGQVLQEIQELRTSSGQPTTDSEIVRSYFENLESDRIKVQERIKRQEALKAIESLYAGGNYHEVVEILEKEQIERELETFIVKDLRQGDTQKFFLEVNGLLSKSYLGLGRYSDADRIYRLLPDIKGEGIKIKLSCISVLLKYQEFDKAIGYLRELENERKFLTTARNAQIEALYGSAYTEMRMFSKAEYHLNRASLGFRQLNHAEANLFLSESAKSNSYLALADSEIGQFTRASETLNIASQALESLKSQISVNEEAKANYANSKLIMGLAFYNMSDITKAMEHCNEAKLLFQELRLFDKQSYFLEYLSCLSCTMKISAAEDRFKPVPSSLGMFEYQDIYYNGQKYEEIRNQIWTLLTDYQFDPHRDLVIYDLRRIWATWKYRESKDKDELRFSILESDIDSLKNLSYRRPWVINQLVEGALALAKVYMGSNEYQKASKILNDVDSTILSVEKKQTKISDSDYILWHARLQATALELAQIDSSSNDQSYHFNQLSECIESLPYFSYAKHSSIYKTYLHAPQMKKKPLKTEEECRFLIDHLNEFSKKDPSTEWQYEFGWIHFLRVRSILSIHQVLQTKDSRRRFEEAYSEALLNIDDTERIPIYEHTNSIRDFNRLKTSFESVKVKKGFVEDRIETANLLGYEDLAKWLSSDLIYVDKGLKRKGGRRRKRKVRYKGRYR